VTGSKTDVQFDKLDWTYQFGFAAFDNAQVRHAYHRAPLTLRFEKWSRARWEWVSRGGTH
jgi:hypothetical protein